MAKIKRVDHIGIAVRDLDAAMGQFERVLGAELIRKQDIQLSGSTMTVAYMKLGETIIGLDLATDPEGFIAKFIERRGEGMHHLAVEVDDIDGFREDLKRKGVRVPHEEEPGGVRKELLLSPKDLCGVVCQVIEWNEGEAATPEERVDRLIRSLDRWEE
jgi:methylmalonyl-CoA/ethylmalonyl-CoA epimerase